MDDFFTWEMLATYAGATVAVGLITQMLKSIKLPTQLLSYVVSVVVLIAAAWFTQTLTLDNAVLCLINAVVVSLASNGGFEAIKRATIK